MRRRAFLLRPIIDSLMTEHIVLAYSGGLDTSVAVHWLAHHHDAKVTAVMVDLGQPIASLDEARARALQNGAEDCIVVDAKEELALRFLAPAIQANALYEGAYPLATALGRPLIAEKLVQVALEVGADAVAHGCTGKGNDQVRIEAAVRALAPQLEVLAPQRTHPMTRDEVLRYAEANDLELPAIQHSPYSVDENLWGRSVEGHDIEDPASAVPENAYTWTTDPQVAPETPRVVTLTFEHGLPVALNGLPMPLHELIAHLNNLVGHHGVGRIDHVENRLVGIKTREIYEAPAAVTILAAKNALEGLCLTRDEVQIKGPLEQKFSELVYDGKFFHPATAALGAFFQTLHSHTNGSVTLQAYKGGLTVLSRSSQDSLVDVGLATYADGDQFHHQASTGFIELWTLPLAVLAQKRGPPVSPTRFQKPLSEPTVPQ